MRAFFLMSFSLLAACAAEPVAYHSGNEIPQGPGLLTGPEGAFVLRTGDAAARESAAPRNAEEEREFQEWRDSKRRQSKQPASQ
jgi:hypothetical protein